MKTSKEIPPKSKNKLDILSFYLRCRNAGLLTVEPVMIIFLLGRLFFFSLLQQYLFSALASKSVQDDPSFHISDGLCLSSSTLSNYSRQVYKDVLSESNLVVAYSQAAIVPAAILVTLMLMPYLDRHGYRLGLILPASGSVLKGVLVILLVYYDVNPYWIPAVSFLCSTSGELVLFMSTSLAYISQVSQPKWVTMRIAICEAAACFGEATGKFLAGFILHVSNCNYTVLLLFFIAFNLTSILYTVLFLPEALTKDQREKTFKGKKFFSVCGELRQIFTESFSKTWRLLILLMYLSISFVLPYGNSLIMLYFLKALPFNFNPLRIGIVQAIIYYGRSMYNILLAVILSFAKVPDVGVIFVSLLVSVSCSVLFGLAREGWEIYTGV